MALIINQWVDVASANNTISYGGLSSDVYLKLQAYLVSQSTANNSSVVKYRAILTWASGFSTINSGRTSTIVVNGNGWQDSKSYDGTQSGLPYTYTNNIVLNESGNITIPHNADGTASVSMSGTLTWSPWSTSWSPSGTQSVPTIAVNTPTITLGSISAYSGQWNSQNIAGKTILRASFSTTNASSYGGTFTCKDSNGNVVGSGDLNASGSYFYTGSTSQTNLPTSNVDYIVTFTVWAKNSNNVMATDSLTYVTSIKAYQKVNISNVKTWRCASSSAWSTPTSNGAYVCVQFTATPKTPVGSYTNSISSKSVTVGGYSATLKQTSSNTYSYFCSTSFSLSATPAVIITATDSVGVTTTYNSNASSSTMPLSLYGDGTNSNVSIGETASAVTGKYLSFADGVTLSAKSGTSTRTKTAYDLLGSSSGGVTSFAGQTGAITIDNSTLVMTSNQLSGNYTGSNGVSVSGNTISGNYTGGTGISVSGRTISLDSSAIPSVSGPTSWGYVRSTGNYCLGYYYKVGRLVFVTGKAYWRGTSTTSCTGAGLPTAYSEIEDIPILIRSYTDPAIFGHVYVDKTNMSTRPINCYGNTSQVSTYTEYCFSFSYISS